MKLVLEEIGIGAVVGVVLAVLGAATLKQCVIREWIVETWLSIPIVALAITCFATAQSLGGSGFIASFVGGLTFGRLVRQHKEQLLHAAEGLGGVFSLLTWVVFGAVVVERIDRALQLEDRSLRRAQFDSRSDRAGTLVADGNRSAYGREVVHRLVWTKGSGERGVYHHRARKTPAESGDAGV